MSAISQKEEKRKAQNAHRNRKRSEKRQIRSAAKLAKLKKTHFLFEGRWTEKSSQPLVQFFATEAKVVKRKTNAVKRQNQQARDRRRAKKVALGLTTFKDHQIYLAHMKVRGHTPSWARVAKILENPPTWFPQPWKRKNKAKQSRWQGA